MTHGTTRLGAREDPWDPRYGQAWCARAAITDEEALIEALSTGRIAGAGLDVFTQEPLPKDSPIRKLDNVVLSPHIVTRESYGPWIVKTVENVLAYMAGDPVRVQNQEAMAKPRCIAEGLFDTIWMQPTAGDAGGGQKCRRHCPEPEPSYVEEASHPVNLLGDLCGHLLVARTVYSVR